MKTEALFIGVISDTHGHLPPAALRSFEGVAHIIHAGDIGSPEVLAALMQVAPVSAVRGNMDGGPWTKGLSTTEAAQIGPALLYVIHDLQNLDLEPAAGGFQAVICGHTHLPAAESRNGVLYLNPGSASLPRRGHPPTVARLRIDENDLSPEFIRISAG